MLSLVKAINIVKLFRAILSKNFGMHKIIFELKETQKCQIKIREAIFFGKNSLKQENFNGKK